MRKGPAIHYDDVIICATASEITSLTIVYSTVYSGPVERKHQSSASLAFVRGIHRWPVNSPHKCQWRGALAFSLIWAWTKPPPPPPPPHKGPVTRKMFPFDDVIMAESMSMPWRHLGSVHNDALTWKRFPHHWPFVSGSIDHRVVERKIESPLRSSDVIIMHMKPNTDLFHESFQSCPSLRCVPLARSTYWAYCLLVNYLSLDWGRGPLLFCPKLVGGDSTLDTMASWRVFYSSYIGSIEKLEIGKF